MSGAQPAPLGFWTTVRLLLLTARKRAAARQAHQRKLFQRRTGSRGWSIYQSSWGLIISIVIALAINFSAAWVVTGVVTTGERFDAEKTGLVVVDRWFIRAVDKVLQHGGQGKALQRVEPGPSKSHDDGARLESYYRNEADEIAYEYGGRADEIAGRLRQAVDNGYGTRLFVDKNDAAPGLAGLPGGRGLAALLGSIALFWWFAMLVCQDDAAGEDTQG